MTLVSDAETAYLDNCDYRETGSVAKAKLFVTACRKLVILLPTVTQKGPNSVSLNVSLVQKQLDEAQEFLLLASPTQIPGTGTTKADFANFRGRSGNFGGRYS